jgi:hypothetical protein
MATKNKRQSQGGQPQNAVAAGEQEVGTLYFIASLAAKLESEIEDARSHVRGRGAGAGLSPQLAVWDVRRGVWQVADARRSNAGSR